MFKNHLSVHTITKTTIAYFLIAILVLVVIEDLFFPGLLNENNLMHWDAKHYFLIKRDGYNSVNVAFFPMLPFLWKTLSLSASGMALLNTLIFGTAFCFLAKTLKLGIQETLLYLTIPGNIFYFLPYTEALFFATSCLVIIGYRTEKNVLIILGLTLSTFVRPIFLFFVLAVIVTELYSAKINRKKILRIGGLLLVLIAGLSAVFTIHCIYTGNWFAYLEIANAWGGGILRLPRLPFTSWSDCMIVRLDGVAMLIGILSGVLLASILLKHRQFKTITVSKDVIFSLTYLSGITLFIIFRGGSIFSLNRFVFAVPFIVVACNFWLSLPLRISAKQLIPIFIGITLFWLLFGSYGHIQSMLKFALVSGYVLLLFMAKLESSSVRKTVIFTFILVNFTFQAIFFFRFLDGYWIG